MNERTRPAVRRRPLAALVIVLALAAACGSSDGDGDDRVGTDTGGDNPPNETTGGSGASECRTQIVEDEYGFEVEVEVCD